MMQEECIIENSLEAHALPPKESLFPTKPSISAANSTPYKNLIFVSIISNQKIPVFLVYIKENDQYCAMKIFPITDTNRNLRYKNEIRFTTLSHPNVIKTVYHEHNRIIASGSISFRASFILTEFAPYGDFFDFVTTYHKFFNEKLIRTYFRQLIEGLEYLHKKEKVGHLDLKLENLFLGTDFVLKIGDFDLSCSLTDKIIVSHGTQNYRAPEVLGWECVDPQAADVYSAGIILFVMMSGGVIPYAENTSSSEMDLFEMHQNNNPEFWEQQCKFQKRSSSYFSSEFRELFNGMIRTEPRERLTIEEIKNSNWYNGPVLSQEQIAKFLEPIVELKHLME